MKNKIVIGMLLLSTLTNTWSNDDYSTKERLRKELIEAANAENISTVNRLLNEGALVNDQDNRGDTALMAASRKGNDIIVKRLLDAGAQIDLRDNEGKTALNWAKKHGKNNIEKILLKEKERLEDKADQQANKEAVAEANRIEMARFNADRKNMEELAEDEENQRANKEAVAEANRIEMARFNADRKKM